MKNKLTIIFLLLSGFFLCTNVLARRFNVIVQNDTENSLEICNVIKNYSDFDDDYQIEDLQKLMPTQRTRRFSVNIYGSSCLKKDYRGNEDGFYFKDTNGNKIGVIWGEISDTGYTPLFGPISVKNKWLETQISVEGIPQDPVYVFTIKKIEK